MREHPDRYWATLNGLELRGNFDHELVVAWIPKLGGNGPAYKGRGVYDLIEVAKLIPGNQVSSHPVRFKTLCYIHGYFLDSQYPGFRFICLTAEIVIIVSETL
jgi:hypothetical protein